MILRRTRSNICAPELYAVEGVVMRLLREWTAADQLIAAALTPRQQPAARGADAKNLIVAKLVMPGLRPGHPRLSLVEKTRRGWPEQVRP